MAGEGSAYPRLLFVTPHAFNHVTGGGVAFTNLFRGWPTDGLATVHNDAEPTSDDVCRHYYRLGLAELDLVEPLASMRRWMRGAGGAAVPSGVNGGASRAVSIKELGVRILGAGLPERGHLTPALERWIDAFRPELLYTILGSNGMMALVDAIRRRFDLPLVVHIMDDWPAAAHRHGLLAPHERRIMDAHLSRLFAAASECLAISDAMAEAYGARYGRPFRPFQNAIDVARWSGVAKSDLAIQNPAELLYVGSIFPNAQLDSLVDCAEAVASLAQTGYPIRLCIAAAPGHGARYRARLEVDPAIRVEDPILDDESFFRRVAAADALLVPVNFDAESLRFIRYSMPAKLPAYMISGTPILVYGPRDAAQVRYALDEGWSHVVDARDPNRLADGMRAILDDGALRRRVTAAASAALRRHHDAAHVRPAFQSVLNEVARKRAAAIP
jgi:glycosyltransferase involved in cell wall biosynthesis